MIADDNMHTLDILVNVFRSLFYVHFICGGILLSRRSVVSFVVQSLFVS
jgi:hypothetical protein